MIRAGNYAGFVMEGDGTAAAPIVFSGEPGATINAPIPSGFGAGRDGINLEGADYIVIEGLRIIGMPRAGIRSVINTNVVIRNNVCDANTYYGIFTGFSENVTIEGNVASRSVLQQGIYASNSADNPIIRGNTVFGNAGSGIHMNSDASAGGDGVITGALIENNVIYDNGVRGGAGINWDGISSSRIQNNLLYNNHAGGITLFRIDGLLGSQNNVIANNTIVLAADSRWSVKIADGSTGNKFLNNVFYTYHSWRGVYDVSPNSLPGLVSDYNVVMDRFTLDDSGSVITLAQWRAQTGQDTHSIVSTPAALFVDPAGNDYRLRAGSPAQDAGVAALGGAAAPAWDRVGNPRPSGPAYDIGMFETQQGSTGGPPTASADSYAVFHDRTLTVAAAGVLGNDASNPTGRPLTAALVSGPANGTLTLNANGSFTYTPNAGFVGTDSFAYRANDGVAASSPATVSLTVTDRAPTATNDSYSVVRDQTLTVSAPGVLGNDADADGDALTAALVSGPANGTLTLNANGSFTYTPNAGFVGTDSFAYRANDKALDSAPATVNLAVTAFARPTVKSIVINDGSAQRSLVRSITITFDTLVTLDRGSFSLVRAGGGAPMCVKTVTTVNGETQVTFTFTGSGTQYRSLIDGHWTFKVFKNRIHRADNRPVTMAADFVHKFHRFYGDVAGDRHIDATDRAAFNAAFGQTDASSLTTFDFDRDGDVDAADRRRFDLRFGRTI